MSDLCFVADMGSQNPVDFNKLAAASWNGIKCVGVIHRATRSNGMVDPAYALRLPQILAAGFLPGAYAFNTGESAADQAARFIKAASPDIPTLLRALDFEHNPNGGQMSIAGVVEFLDRVDQKFGRYTALYSGDQVKTLIVHATDAQREDLAKHPLWGCEYGPEFKAVDDAGRPLPWPAPFLWQCTGDGVGPQPHTLDGLQPGADLSIFKGTREDLAKVWPGLPIVAAPPIAAATPPIAPAGAPAANAADGWFASFMRSIRSIG